jgi:hypothetical protein
MGGQLTLHQPVAAFGRLVSWPGRHLAPLLFDAWGYRQKFVIADALYLVLALRLGTSTG